MGRNRLSFADKIKKFSYYEKKVGQLADGNSKPLMKEIRTIRSKSLRVFVLKMALKIK